MSFFSNLSSQLTKAAEQACRVVDQAATQIQQTYDSVDVQCCNCGAILRPPTGQPTFTCGHCSVLLLAPTHADKLAVHTEFGFGAAGAKFEQAVNSVQHPAFVTMDVTVPPGAEPGQTVIILGMTGEQIPVAVPPGLREGDTFPVNVPGQPAVAAVGRRVLLARRADGGAAAAVCVPPPPIAGQAGPGTMAAPPPAVGQPAPAAAVPAPPPAVAQSAPTAEPAPPAEASTAPPPAAPPAAPAPAEPPAAEPSKAPAAETPQ